MRFVNMPCDVEVHSRPAPGGTVMLGTYAQRQDALIRDYAGRVQAVYLDPPFYTGKDFTLRQRVGKAGYTSGRPVLTLPAYSDKWADEASFLAMLRGAIELSHTLLQDDGSFFLHIDARMHARLRLIADAIFGAHNFVNEIVWAYQTGGRSLSHFSRKHDIILFYRKTPGAYFNIREVGMKRSGARRNHMKKAVDKDGRAYRSIVSQGKEYRYYDDDPVYPGDVWDDVSHLQQKDPQRTGYDTQKPLRLLERILLSTTKPGDLVADLFAGSGTTAVAAALNGRRYLALDAGQAAVSVMRKRLLPHALRVEAPCVPGAPRLAGSVSLRVGLAEVRLSRYALEEGLTKLALPGVEAVDQISAGYLRGREFHAFDSAVRSKQEPELKEALEIPVLDGCPAILTVDVLGRRMVHVMEDIEGGE